MKKVILAAMILVPFIPFIMVLGIGYYYFTSALERNTIATMRRVVEDHRQMIDSFLSERRADLEFVLNTVAPEELIRTPTLKATFRSLQQQSSAFVDLGIFDADGLHIAYAGPYSLEGKIYKNEPWFIEVCKKGYYVSDVFLGFRQVPHFIIAVTRRYQQQLWVLRATIDTHLFNALVESVRIGKSGEAYLLNADGIFQTERRSGGALMAADPDHGSYSTSPDGIRAFLAEDRDGEDYLYAATWLSNKHWLLVVRQEQADAFHSLRTATYLIVLITVIGGSVIVAVAFYLTDRIVRRIEKTEFEKDQLGNQLIRASRLAEIGEMATGFAHEINNPLQIIKSEQTLIKMIVSDLKAREDIAPLEEINELEDSLNQIEVQIHRCATITQAILKFGRQDEPHIERIHLADYVPEVVAMIQKKAEVHGIEVVQEIDAETPSIMADSGQLQQVLLNLFNNAIDAVMQQHGTQAGKLVISTRADSQRHAEIRVQDNGCGISPENQKKIFSPFFTTKPVGKGTGLGLAVCYGIINSMGGSMAVESHLGQGTVFILRLPPAI
jgi:two-component system NtrC family sensor kinase